MKISKYFYQNIQSTFHTLDFKISAFNNMDVESVSAILKLNIAG